jgi:hypothetical protein
VISPTGPAATEFHVAKQDGWPIGQYRFTVTVNGQPAMAVDYAVTE